MNQFKPYLLQVGLYRAVFIARNSPSAKLDCDTFINSTQMIILSVLGRFSFLFLHSILIICFCHLFIKLCLDIYFLYLFVFFGRLADTMLNFVWIAWIWSQASTIFLSHKTSLRKLIYVDFDEHRYIKNKNKWLFCNKKLLIKICQLKKTHH